MIQPQVYTELYQESNATLIMPVDVLIQAIKQSADDSKHLSATEFAVAIRIAALAVKNSLSPIREYLTNYVVIASI